MVDGRNLNPIQKEDVLVGATTPNDQVVAECCASTCHARKGLDYLRNVLVCTRIPPNLVDSYTLHANGRLIYALKLSLRGDFDLCQLLGGLPQSHLELNGLSARQKHFKCGVGLVPDGLDAHIDQARSLVLDAELALGIGQSCGRSAVYADYGSRYGLVGCIVDNGSTQG